MATELEIKAIVKKASSDHSVQVKFLWLYYGFDLGGREEVESPGEPFSRRLSSLFEMLLDALYSMQPGDSFYIMHAYFGGNCAGAP